MCLQATLEYSDSFRQPDVDWQVSWPSTANARLWNLTRVLGTRRLTRKAERNDCRVDMVAVRWLCFFMGQCWLVLITCIELNIDCFVKRLVICKIFVVYQVIQLRWDSYWWGTEDVLGVISVTGRSSSYLISSGTLCWPLACEFAVSYRLQLWMMTDENMNLLFTFFRYFVTCICCYCLGKGSIAVYQLILDHFYYRVYLKVNNIASYSNRICRQRLHCEIGHS